MSVLLPTLEDGLGALYLVRGKSLNVTYVADIGFGAIIEYLGDTVVDSIDVKLSWSSRGRARSGRCRMLS